MKLLESQTYLNLAKAWTAECSARVRYEFIEYGLRANDYKQVAIIVDKIVYNEFNHARMFYTKIQDASEQEIKNIDFSIGLPFKEKWEIIDNLRLAGLDEEAEIKLYPKFAEVAEKEGFNEIALLFKNIAKTEQNHKKIFEFLYKELKNKTLYKSDKPTKWICADCGYIHYDKNAPATCPVCNAKQGSFKFNMPIKF